ncbi:thioredoxin domain-containing protein 11-like isoform X2 [Watersipora subatra]|uniref:thioredoxin domain-containing protein 11-like isoform X2 n=1 Tax=Watersipora subatra TaxID=2589382 RepID=UPI00355BE881
MSNSSLVSGDVVEPVKCSSTLFNQSITNLSSAEAETKDDDKQASLKSCFASSAVLTCSEPSFEEVPVDEQRAQSNSLSNCKMLMGVAVCYFFAILVPDIAKQLVQASRESLSASLTSVPTDGPSTIYQSAKPAEPFFAFESPVHDSYTGALHVAGKVVKENGYVFVMYYASWSLNSMLARKEFETAANMLNDRVPFIAIDCSNSNQCKSKYKFYSFPSFYFYASGMDIGFSYTGVAKAEYFVRFIESLLNPITHIFNSSQLTSFVSSHESSLVGYFNLSKTEPAGRFQQFYYASLRSIEKDFLQPVRFGVLSDHKFASQYSMNEDRNLMLVRSIEENLVYPTGRNFTSTAISAWVNKYRAEPLVKWLLPRGKKAIELYKTLKSGPTVLLLTPYDACSSHNRDAMLLREVVLNYYSCNGSSEAKKKVQSFIRGSIQARSESSATFCMVCESPVMPCCYTVANSSLCQVCESRTACKGNCSPCENLLKEKSLPTAMHACSSVRRQLPGLHDNEVCCSRVSHDGRHFTDDYVRKHRHCSPANSGFTQPHFNDTMRLSTESYVCKHNATPNFLAMDSHLYTDLANRFGIGSMGLSTSHLALVDLSDESYYLMKGSFNRTNIVNFLEDYNAGNIVRSYDSIVSKTSNPMNDSSDKISVRDLNVVQFEQIVSNMNRKRDVVVLFYSKWCIHCKAVNHIFLSVMEYLTQFTSIKFYRMDIHSNTLPWKYAVNRVPAIAIFPYRGDAEQVPLMNDMEQLLRYIVSRCGLKHLIELTIRGTYSSLRSMLPIIRVRERFFIIHASTMTARVVYVILRRSPIIQGGLEIEVEVTAATY